MQVAMDAALDVTDVAPLLELLEQYKLSAIAPSPSAELDTYKRLETQLTLLSQQLGRNASLRQPFVDSASLSSIFESLDAFLPVFQQIQHARPSAKQEEPHVPEYGSPQRQAEESEKGAYQRACHIATLLMRISRNAMAGCSDAQNAVCSRFDLVASFLDNITRFHTLNDPDTTLLSRSAVQMLSNLITANPAVQRQLWPRIVITDKDQDKFVLKFLSSSDTATQSAAQILLINFLRSSASNDAYRHCFQLCTTSSGHQLLESLLSTSQSIMLRTASATQDESNHEYEPESETEGLEESLGFIYTIFATLFERGFSSLLVSALAPIEGVSSSPSGSSPSDFPVVSSSQLTLLKLLDSWLHLQQKQIAEASCSSRDEASSRPVFDLPRAGSSSKLIGDQAARGAGLAGLIDMLMHLSKFARSAMASGTAKDGASADQQPQDRRLIGVHHALLLLLQSLLSIAMTADGWSAELSSLDETRAHATLGFEEVSRALLSDMRRNLAFVDELVALLDQTHQYAPALSPFRPVKSTTSSEPGQAAADKASNPRPLPQGHALSSTGRAAHESKGTQPSYGFDHLKRDIVRVLGSLVYTPKHVPREGAGTQTSDFTSTASQIRFVQDRIRDKGGLFHVLNMTVLDERNPYMREHAIFALRYLLAGNTESQNLVASLQPAQPDATRGGIQLPMV